MEVAVGLEPTKTGFAGQRLDRFGIAISVNPVKLCDFIPKNYTHPPPPTSVEFATLFLITMENYETIRASSGMESSVI